MGRLRVSLMLSRCQNTRTEKFELKLKCHDLASNVDAWVRFAVENKVTDLCLDFASYRYHGSFHCVFSNSTLINFVFTKSSLINLSLWGCGVTPEGSINCTSLKSVTINDGVVNNGKIEEILSSCPMLEYLKIAATTGVDRLDINSESLKELVIDFDGGDEFHSMKISAPRLESFCLFGFLLTHIHLISASSLLKVVLDFHMEDDDSCYESQCNCIIQLLGSLHNAVELELGLQCIPALLRLKGKALKSQLSRITCLKLNAYAGEPDVPDIISLLKSSPNLETLVVDKIGEDAKLHCQNSCCPKAMELGVSRLQELRLKVQKKDRKLSASSSEDCEVHWLSESGRC